MLVWCYWLSICIDASSCSILFIFTEHVSHIMMFLEKNKTSINFYWQVMTAFEGSDIRVPQLPSPYCKAVQENSVGFQLLLSAKDYILSF